MLYVERGPRAPGRHRAQLPPAVAARCRPRGRPRRGGRRGRGLRLAPRPAAARRRARAARQPPAGRARGPRSASSAVRPAAYAAARRVPLARPQSGGVGRRRRRGRRARRAPAPAPARRRVVAAAACAAPVALCVAAPAHRARATSAIVRAADVGLHRDVRDAQRRPRGARARACSIDYPVRIDRALGLGELPSVRLQRALGAPGRDPTRLDDACSSGRTGSGSSCPHGDGRLPPRPPPRALPARGGADLRGLRPRRARLLGDADRAAVVRGAAGRMATADRRAACGG